MISCMLKSFAWSASGGRLHVARNLPCSPIGETSVAHSRGIGCVRVDGRGLPRCSSHRAHDEHEAPRGFTSLQGNTSPGWRRCHKCC